jgi:hypothetical protein
MRANLLTAFQKQEQTTLYLRLRALAAGVFYPPLPSFAFFSPRIMVLHFSPK